MNNLILPGASGATMTSVDLRDVINDARSEIGETKGKLIGTIVREMKFKALEVGDGSFCEGDAFFSLAFKTEKELIKIARLCGVEA